MRELIVFSVGARGDRGGGDGSGGGDVREDPCEDVERSMLLMRCPGGARGRGDPYGCQVGQDLVESVPTSPTPRAWASSSASAGPPPPPARRSAAGRGETARLRRALRDRSSTEVNATTSGPQGCGSGRRSLGLFSDDEHVGGQGPTTYLQRKHKGIEHRNPFLLHPSIHPSTRHK
jgi:hypothetical protein